MKTAQNFTILFSSLMLSFLSGTPLCAQDFFMQLSDSSITLTKQNVRYDPGYYRIPYPGGDVPSDRGVCTDVLIRAYRKMGIDLQKEIHEDMLSRFGEYPHLWGLRAPDKNIDHRRVPNMAVFFSRKGSVLKISSSPDAYKPGDIVTWDLGNGIPHIGIIVNRRKPGSSNYMIVHNIGQGQVMEDCLFRYKITGHYRYQKNE